ncbi:hypothetical protein RB195_002049 [Necator americanus]|uniref:Uncharacterized protein n=1 Tax=Necator americanus TaxID=51031 RepID=A0ABR1DIM3_NECAM
MVSREFYSDIYLLRSPRFWKDALSRDIFKAKLWSAGYIRARNEVLGKKAEETHIVRKCLHNSRIGISFTHLPESYLATSVQSTQRSEINPRHKCDFWL